MSAHPGAQVIQLLVGRHQADSRHIVSWAEVMEAGLGHPWLWETEVIKSLCDS